MTSLGVDGCAPGPGQTYSAPGPPAGSGLQASVPGTLRARRSRALSHRCSASSTPGHLAEGTWAGPRPGNPGATRGQLRMPADGRDPLRRVAVLGVNAAALILWGWPVVGGVESRAGRARCRHPLDPDIAGRRGDHALDLTDRDANRRHRRAEAHIARVSSRRGGPRRAASEARGAGDSLRAARCSTELEARASLRSAPQA